MDAHAQIIENSTMIAACIGTSYLYISMFGWHL